MAEGLKYGLKLWSTNLHLVEHALAAHRANRFDFIELNADPTSAPDFEKLRPLLSVPVTIHATHSQGFHEFVIGDNQIKIWEQTLRLADFFNTDVIVLHPGRDHTFETFQENLLKIDDARIYIENMAGLDIHGIPMFGQNIDDLRRIVSVKPICFDFEKAVKAACHQEVDYKTYITKALQVCSPTYFHISGGDSMSPIDQHLNLPEANFDLVWMKDVLETLGDTRVVFETPKRDGIENDLFNMMFFRNL